MRIFFSRASSHDEVMSPVARKLKSTNKYLWHRYQHHWLNDAHVSTSSRHWSALAFSSSCVSIAVHFHRMLKALCGSWAALCTSPSHYCFSIVGYKNKKENLWAFHLKGTLCVHQSLWVTPFTLHTHRFISFFYSKNTHWYRIYKIYNMTQHHGQEKDWLYLQLQYLFVKKIMKYLIILNYLHSIVILVRCVYSSLTVS